ncbi:major facilitator superfamily domain-containing protein [Coniochaeta sp. 2T2.1]|nr:major facilitator superfamily domain-containing protein [Coniochaeta sp. 2T2.1]
MASFFILGLFTSTIGVVLPYLESYYSLTDTQVSTIFLVAPVGYILASSLTSLVHLRLGQRGIAVIGPLFQIVFAAGAAANPPFPLLLVAVACGNFGAGLLDASWCAWAAGRENANAVSGLLHGSYSAGAAVGPFVAGALLAGGRPWYHWYYVLLTFSLLELLVLPLAFRHEDATRYRQDKNHYPTQSSESTTLLSHAKSLLSRPVIWASAGYLLTYAGTELAISDWIVVYMLRARHATPYLASLCSSSFWVGMAVGRFSLGPVTDRFGVRAAVVVYILFDIASDLLFYAVDAPVAAVILTAALGFWCGPLFPSAIVRLNSSLPRELHVPAVAFVASVGQVGGAVLPFGLGVVAERCGIGVFQGVIFVQMAASLGIWMVFPSGVEGTDDGCRQDVVGPVLP